MLLKDFGGKKASFISHTYLCFEAIIFYAFIFFLIFAYY